MILYSTLKATAIALYGKWIAAGGVIESDSGSPTTLAIYFNFVNSMIAGYPHEWGFCKEVAEITLDGSSEYNLATLIPDYLSTYQVYGLNDYQEEPYLANDEANISASERGYTIRGSLLVPTGTPPTSGTLKVQYKSKYLVKNSAGTRKQYFEDDSDYSVLSSPDDNVLTLGIGKFVNYKIDERSKSQRDENRADFKEAWNSMILRNDQTNQITSML